MVTFTGSTAVGQSIMRAAAGNVKKIGSKLISSKKGMHGLGLESVNAVVDKYHGVMNVSNSDDMFTVSLVIFF